MIQIVATSIIADIKRHLSIIGKRLSKDGKNMFSDITLSSAADTQILTQYIKSSVQNVEAMLKQFVTACSYSGSAFSITIANTRGDSDFEARTLDMVKSFVVLNTTGEYLSMTHPDLAEKYRNDALQSMESLLTYVFYKKPPVSSTSFTDPTGVVLTDIIINNNN